MARDSILVGQLEAFLEIARLGNLTRAAESMFLTQPALSARLKRLEQEVGFALLVRNRQGARLTDAGRAFLPHARAAVEAVEDGQKALSVHLRAGMGELVVGATPTVGAYVLPGVIRRMSESQPKVRLSIRTATSVELLAMLLRGDVTLAIGRQVHHPSVESIPLYDEDYILVSLPDHRLASGRRLHLADLADEVLILYERSPIRHVTAEALLRQIQVAPRAVIDLDSAIAAKELVNQGVGIALLPRTVVSVELAAGSLMEIRISDMKAIRRSVAVIGQRNISETPLCVEFIAHLRQQITEMGFAHRRS